MNHLLLNSNFASCENKSLTLPTVTLKRFVRKTPRPELGRYLRKTEIEGYKEILTAKTLRFLERDNPIERFKSTRTFLAPIISKSKTSPVLSNPSQITLEVISHDKPIIQHIRLSRKSTPEPRVVHIEIPPGKTMADISNCEEPEIPLFTEKVHRMIVLPDIIPIKATFKKAHNKTNHNFKLIQEDMKFNK